MVTFIRYQKQITYQAGK